MLRYVVRRLIQAAGVMLALSFLLFLWLRSLPGGPVSALLGERATEAKRIALRKTLGLDQPLLLQYWHFLGRAVTGDFGSSTGVQPGDSATGILLQRLPATIELTVAAMFFAIITAIPLGYLAAKRRGGVFDTLSVVSSLVGVAVPVFFLAFVLKYVFAVKLGILPPAGRQSVDLDPDRITGFFVLDGILSGQLDAAWDAVQHLILPAIALGSIPFAVIFRITRASVLEVLDADHVRTAESKGLRPSTIRRRHVLRNALLPVVTTIGLQTGALLGGAVLTEKVFAFPGLGDALAQAFNDQDFAVLQVLILVAALVYVLVNLVVDLSYAFLDPRVRLA